MQGLDDVRGWGSLQAGPLHSLAPGQRWSLQIVKGTAAAGTQQCGGRLPPPGRSSRELTADLHTVRSPPSYLASYKTGHRRRRQQTSNLFLSAQPGLSQQTYFGKDIEMKGVGLSQRGLQRSLFTNLRKVLQLYNICFNCPCYEDQGISELTL